MVLVDEPGQQGEDHGGQNAGDDQGETACGGGKVSQLGSFAGAYHMTGGAEGNTLGNLVCEPKDLAKERADDGGKIAGNGNGGGGYCA